MGASSTRPGAELASSRYELLRPLGKGGVGAVYLARDRETGQEVALKKLFRVDPRSVQRFKREFRAIADLHHRNLVKLFDLQRAEDEWYAHSVLTSCGVAKPEIDIRGYYPELFRSALS